MSLLELIESLEIIAGAHGVGRTEVAEAPAAALLQAAHRSLEQYALPPDLNRLKADLAGVYAALLADGRWYSATREAIDAFVASTQRHVTGTVRLKLYKGECEVVGRRLEPGAPAPADHAAAGERVS
jgi:argininosuccinate synthase